MPVRGFGLKNVVFCGMRARSTAAARVWATVTGEHRIAAPALPFSTAAAVRRRRGGTATTRPEPGDDERLDQGGIGGRDGRVLALERGRPHLGARDREREPPRVRRARVRRRRACGR